MAPFKKDSKFSSGARRPFSNTRGPRQRFGSRDGGRPSFGSKEMFEAECNSCHKMCQVPFRPNGKKPVYCSDCFKQDDNRQERPRFDKPDFRTPRSFGPSAAPAQDPRIDGLKRQLDTMQATLDKLVSTLETSNRAAALTKVMHKYVPADKPARAPAKKVAKSTATAATKPTKKSVTKGKAVKKKA